MTTVKAAEASRPMPGRWAVLGGAWGAYVAFGLLVASTGALVPDIKADLGLSDAEMGLVLGAWQLVFVGSSIPAGRILDRFGVRRALMASMVIMLVSGLGRAFSGGFFSLFLAVAVFGAGAPITSVGSPKLAAALFEGRDRQTAVAIYSTAPGIGGVLGLVLPANVIGPLVGDDWRAVMLVLTGIAGVALVYWALVSRGLDDLIIPGVGPDLKQYRSIARLPVVRFVLVLAIVSFVFVHGIGQWVVAILNDAGWSTKEAGLWAAVGTGGGLVASYALPRIATPGRRPYLMVGSLVIGAGALNFLQSTSVGILLPAVLITMTARTALMPLLIMTLMDHRDVGPERIAAATGLFFTTAQIGGVAGPAITGLLADLSGGFDLPLAMHSLTMLAVAAAIALGYRRVVDFAPPPEETKMTA